MKKVLVLMTAVFALFFLLTAAVSAEELDVWEQAKEEGVHFRAVGNEPGWLVEIRDDKRIKFVNDYGDLEIKAPVDDLWLGPAGEDKIYYVENEAVQFQVIIMKKSYQDTMSDESYPYQVRVVFPNKSYVGGGRLLIQTEN
ncbi:MAG: COG3650 family protein [Bacillota bacterium]